MKRYFSAILFALSFSAFGATTVPVQLLNPSGSSSGQAIVSTGASSAPAWGGVGVNGIAAIAANTVLANATGSSASPTAFSMPSCSTSSSALDWTSGSGFTCNTAVNAAQLLGSTWASPPASGYGSTTPESVAATTISATGLISPTSTIGVKGTTTNDNAQAGSIGEYQTAGPTTTGNLTSGTAANITSVSLTAGDWDVTGVCAWAPSSTTLVAEQCGITTTSAAFGSFGSTASLFISAGTTSGSGIDAPVVRISVASTTTVYLVTQVGISSGTTVTATGLIRARRIR